MKKISRRDFLKVAGIGATAIGLTACGGSDSSSTAASSTTGGDQVETITLRVADWSDSSKAYRDAFHEKFMAENPDIKVGVQQDTTGDIYSSSAISGWGFNDLNEDESIKTDRVVRYKTGAEAVAALKTGKVDCVIIDNEPAKSFVKANEGIHILEGDNEYAIEDYAICVDKGNTELLEKINKALEELKADGTIDGIINKYIPKDGGVQ